MLFNIKATIKIKKKKRVFKGFNPLTYDAANLLALYNGDTLNIDPPGTWVDQSINGYDLTFFNNPVVVTPAINGHDAIQFDGVNQYGNNALIPLTQPLSIYIVFKQITYTGEILFNSGSGGANIICYQSGIPNEININSGAALTAIPDPNLAYDILTNIYNGINSEIRTNNNIAVAGNVGVNNGLAIFLASNFFGGAGFLNCEIAYLIIRNGADNTATQNLFINYFKNRFAL